MRHDQLKPNTIDSLSADFKMLGVKEGMTLIVHSSLKSLGWTCGGAVAVIEALMKTVGDSGTIVMPTQSADLSDPSYWENPPVPEEWWETIRSEMPVYNPRTTPTYGMGKIVECFRSYEGVIRSNHPTTSFAAWGQNKEHIVSEHSLAFSLGEASPLQKLYDLEAFILLLGVGYDSNTSLHLAEAYADSCYTYQQFSPIVENGVRVWKEYEEFMYNVENFNDIGQEFERNNNVAIGQVGMATCRLIPQRPLVDFATKWLINEKNRTSKL